MAENKCPVQSIVMEFSGLLDDKAIQEPKTRRIVEQILSLMDDISAGQAGGRHLEAVERLVAEFFENPENTHGVEIGKKLEKELNTNKEVFESHIQTHNCPTMDCFRLAPSPCQMACPAGIDIPTYLHLIAKGKDAEAIEVIRRDNPLPWVCGLICTRPCEMMCVRGRIDTPVSIKFLKAFAAERALSDRAYTNPEPEEPNGHKVCVVGAGPAGLSAAYYLALNGYTVRVIESLPIPGGMLMVGIPRYRLPREAIDRETAMIEDLGVEFQYNTRFGTDVTLDELKEEGFEAFFLAIGAHSAWEIGIKGEKELSGVIDAVTFLKDVALGDRHTPGKHVVIIGGGNVAIDAARTSLRLGAEKVTVAYRRSRSEMPADEEEVEQAETEGIEFAFLTIPTEIVGDNGKAAALWCTKAELVKKENSDRMSPVPMLGSDFVIQADAVISAIGQFVNRKGMQAFSDVNWTRRGTIEVSNTSMETNMPGVFAAGDAVLGPATVIEAIGGGKRAAESIDRYFNNLPQPTIPKVPVRHRKEPFIEMSATTKMTLKRPEMHMLNIDRRRTTFQQAELGYTEDEVRKEATRCLRCDICRRCGECVSVCRDKMGIDALQFGFMDFDHPTDTDFRKTSERCITCGACAHNCPNGAMTIQEKDGMRILSLCGTVLNKQEILHCESCGAVMGPERYLDFIRNKTRSVGQVFKGKRLCETCLRQKTARTNVDVHPVE